MYGLDAIPAQWVDQILNCPPQAGHPRVRHARPECFCPLQAIHKETAASAEMALEHYNERERALRDVLQGRIDAADGQLRGLGSISCGA